MTVSLYRPELSGEEAFAENLRKEAQRSQEESRTEQVWKLPESIAGSSISWSERKEDDSLTVFALAAAAAVLMFFFRDKDLHKKADRREKELLLGYPDLISRMVVYLMAGLTVRMAWRRMAEETADTDYPEISREILLTVREMDSGVSEAAAYDRFGKRCRNARFAKFSTLLIQNLNRGSDSLAGILRIEASEALEEQKYETRRHGEEAGTKLLAPMMLELGVVMVMILIPAFLSFS